MANKVFSIENGYAASTLSAQQVYVDIDIDSIDSGRKIGNYIVYKHLLKEQLSELYDTAENDEDKEHAILCTDPKDDRCRITFLGTDKITYEKAKARLLKKAKYKISTLVNVQSIQNSLRNIFTWIPGERVLNPEFGSNLQRMLYEGITSITRERIVSEIYRCIHDWEPRVSVQEVIDLSTTEDTTNNIIHLEIIYTIPSLTEDQYYNYPYITRTTIV